MLTFAKKYSKNVYSQCGEDGILEEVIDRIALIGGTSVEFGAPTREYCSNTFNLPDHWVKYYFDINPTDPNVVKMEITTDNINTLRPCTILSMDTDGPDYELWSVYTGVPDIVVIEINSSLSPMKDHYDKESGASYISMVKLGIHKGYFLLCHTGNLIFVASKYRALFPEIVGDGIENWEEYFNKSWLNANV